MAERMMLTVLWMYHGDAGRWYAGHGTERSFDRDQYVPIGIASRPRGKPIDRSDTLEDFKGQVRTITTDVVWIDHWKRYVDDDLEDVVG